VIAGGYAGAWIYLDWILEVLLILFSIKMPVDMALP